MKFDDFPIRTRLLSTFGMIVVLLISVAITGYQGMKRSNEAIHQIVDINVSKIFLLNEMSTSVHIVSRVIRSIALLHEEAETSSQAVKITEARKQYDDAEAALEKMPLDDKGREFLGKIKEAAAESRAFNDKFLGLTKSDQEAAVKSLMSEGLAANTKWQSLLLDYTKLQLTKNKTFEEETQANYHSATLFVLIFTLLATLFAVLVSWFISRSIVRQIGCEPKEAIGIAQQITQGDLTVQIVTRPGDSTSLFHSIKLMRDNLAKIVTQVRLASDSIADNSRDIVTGNMDLSSRTEHQASALEQTASSMEELTSTVKQNAENSQQANKLSNAASNVAAQGGVVVSQVISTMDSINSSSQKIVDIISVIDGIAFQTNILALNAAVEAARAGEQGRGFAVVATEVRNLAQRSASAAKEVKALIDDSVEKVTLGSRLVNQAGTTMAEVVTSVGHVTGIIGEIAAASNEQNAGIEQINEAIISMDNVTQQNAALVEEAAAASASLQTQVENLVQLISVFKVDEAGRPASVTALRAIRPAASKITTTPPAVKTVQSIRPARVQNAAADTDWEEF